MATGRVPTTANSPLTAKGDLFGYSTTQARVPVGNDGETLVADSAASTGLRYQVPVNVNPIINSNFSVWQRGTNFTLGAANAYTADRWLATRAATVTGMAVSRQATGDTTNLPFIQYCARVQRVSGDTSTNKLYIGQCFETVNSIPFAGKVITVSFYARAGANYSATSSALRLLVNTGTGTDQNIITGTYTGNAQTIDQTATLTTTWQRFSFTGTVAATATELTTWFESSVTGTAGANDWYEITGVQLEVGSVATPYKPTGATFQGELAACQRYYYRKTGTQPLGMGYAQSTTVTRTFLSHPMQMRTAPTMATNSGTNFFYFALGGTDTNGSSLTFDTASVTSVAASLTLTSGTPTTGYPGRLALDNASAYLEGSAEL